MWWSFSFVSLATVMTCCLPASAMAADTADKRFEVMLERVQNGKWHSVDAHTVFSADEEIRFRFRSSLAGYLYVLNQTSSGDFLWLYPTTQAETENRFEARREYFIPAGEGSFVIPSKAGYDLVFWIVSPVKIDSLPALPRRPESESRAPLLPRCKEGLLKARGVCMDDSASARRLDDPEWLPNVMPTPPLKSQDALIETNPAGNEISFRNSRQGRLIYKMKVAHR